MEEVLDLGFGKCKLQLQVPEKGSLQKPEQLIGKNICTSFTALAEAYFRKLEEQEDKQSQANGTSTNGSKDSATSQKKLRTNIKYLGGSVEAACALGVADGIVDLVGEFHIIP